MSTYAGQLSALGRVPWVLLELTTAKRCTDTYADGVTCTATDLGDGSRCYYTHHTCQKLADFTAGSHTWRWCSAGLPLPKAIMEAYPQIAPTIKDCTPVKREIDIEKGFASTEKAKVTLYDEGGRTAGGSVAADCPPFDLDKSTRNTSRAGTFWKRWLAQWPHYRGMEMKILRGFVTPTFPYSELEEVWIGKLEEVTIDGGIVTLHGVDLLAATMDKQLPTPTSSTVYLTAVHSRTTTTLNVTDTTDITDPADVTGDVVVSVETVTGRTEDMIVSAKTSTTLTVTRGDFDTYPEPLPENATVTESYVVRDIRPLDLALDVLNRVGLASGYIDSAQFAVEAQFIGPATLERRIRKPENVREMLFGILEPFQAFLYPDESLKVRACVQGPARIGETVATVTDAANILHQPNPIMRPNDKGRLTHCAVYHGFPEGSDSTKEADGCVLAINDDGWVATYYGNTAEDLRGKTIKALWIRGDDNWTAHLAAVRWARAFGQAPRRFRWSAELNDATMAVGQLVDVTCSEITDEHGATLSTRCLIVSKEPIGLSGFRFEAVPTQFELVHRIWDVGAPNVTKRWAFFTDAAAAVWGSASTSEKARGYIADASALMSDATPGYRFI